MGVGGAMIMPATLSVIMDIFPREERGKAIGIWSAIAGVGIGLGPFVGGLLLEWFSWSSVFWLNVPIVGVALVAGFVLVPESRDPKPGAFDLRGATLSIATLVTLVYGIIEASPRGWTDPLVLGCFAAAARPRRRLRHVGAQGRVADAPAGVLPRSALHRRLRGRRARVLRDDGLHLRVHAVPAVRARLQRAGGRRRHAPARARARHRLRRVQPARRRLGRTRVIAGGLIGVAPVLSTSLAWTPDMAPVLLALVTFGLALSMGAAMAPATESVMSAVPEAKAGVGSAMSDVTRQVGGALGVAVIGSIISTAYSRDMTGAPDAAGESVGAAHALAQHVGGTTGRELADTAGRRSPTPSASASPPPPSSRSPARYSSSCACPADANAPQPDRLTQFRPSRSRPNPPRPPPPVPHVSERQHPMIEFTIETCIERPPATVFHYVSDPDRLATWQTNTVSSIQESDGPFGLGTRLREIHRTPGGKEIESVVEVSEYQPDRTLGLRVVEGMPVHVHVTLEPAERGTLMRFRAHGRLTGTMRLAQPLLQRVLKRQFARQCATLKQVLEAA